MAYRPAHFYLLGLLLLAGCAGKPSVQQDITLANTGAQSPVQTAATRNAVRLWQPEAETTTSTAIVTGSGAMTNIVSDPSVESSRTARDANRGAQAGPVAVPSPVQPPTRLATAVMIEPASPTALGSEGTTVAAAIAGESSSASGAASSADATKVASKVVTFKRIKPGCQGADCPVLNFKQLTFTGYERFNAFLEQTLLSLALVETNHDKAFRDLPALELYFFKTAKLRDEITLASSVKFMSAEVVVVQLDSDIVTGGAQRISTTQYLNWLPKTDKLLTLEAMLLPGKLPAFEDVLKKQHTLWLRKNPLAKDDLAAYSKLWPFEPSDNVALLENGAAVTYDPYRLAPYSFGKPTIYIPYRDLKGILRPELLPKS
jgi:hypothetical protein